MAKVIRTCIDIEIEEIVRDFVNDNGTNEVAEIINAFLEEAADKFGDDVLHSIMLVENKIASIKKDFEE